MITLIPSANRGKKLSAGNPVDNWWMKTRELAIILEMKTHSLDILEKAELPPAQAHAILKVMELEMASAHESLATKADVMELRMEMKAIEGTLSRWVLTCILGQTAVLAGLGYFFLAHFGR